MEPVRPRTNPKLGRKLAWWAATVILALICSYIERTPSATTRAGAASPSKLGPQAEARLAGEYGRLPLSFEANRGQTDPQVKFLARGRGYGLFLTRDEAVLEVQGSGARDEIRNSKLETRPERQPVPRNPNPESRTPAVLRMRLVGANSNASVT